MEKNEHNTPTPGKEPYDEWIEQGILFAGEGKLTEAREAFVQAQEVNPSGLEVLANLGTLEQLTADHKEAISYFDQALAIDPTHVNSLYNKGISLAALRRFDEALEIYDQVIHLDPSYTRVYMAKGYALMQNKQDIQAKALFESFLQMSGEGNKDQRQQVELWLKAIESPAVDEDHYDYLAEARKAMSAGDGQSAIRFLNKFLEIYPADHMVLIQRAYLYAQTDQTEQSQEDSAMAERLSPNDPWVYYFQAKIELLEKNQEKAKDLLERAIKIDPLMAEPYVELAGIASNEEDRFQLLSKAITLHPRNPEAYILRGKIFQEKGRVIDALSDFSRAISIDPDQTEIYQWIEDVLGYLADHIQTQPNDPLGYSQRAQAFMKLERYEDALSDWSSALAIQPDNPLLIRGLAEAHWQSGQASRAVDGLSHALKKYPDIPEFWLDRAHILLSLMRTSEAEADLLEAISLDPMLKDAHFLKGQVHASKEEWLEAETHLKQALQLGESQPELFRQLALLSIQQDKLEESLNYFEQGIALGINVDILMDAAQVAHALGHDKKALLYTDRLLSHWPQYADAWQFKTQLHLERDERDKAYSSLSQQVRVNPMPLEPWQQKMRMALEFDRWEELLQSAGRVITILGKEEEALKHRALAYYHLGKSKLALRDLREWEEVRTEEDEELAALLDKLETELPPPRKKSWWKWK